MTLKIKSVSDVITNSSSETFTLKGISNIQEFIETLKEHATKHMWYNGPWGKDYMLFRDEPKDIQNKYNSFSGDCRDPEIMTWENRYEQWINYTFPRKNRSKIDPEIWALSEGKPLEELKSEVEICLDQDFKPTINWLVKNFYCIDVDVFGWKYENGRVVGHGNWFDRKQIPEEDKKDFDKITMTTIKLNK